MPFRLYIVPEIMRKPLPSYTPMVRQSQFTQHLLFS